MKNLKNLPKIAFAAAFLVFFSGAAAENMQIVFPKNANIGDTIEIKYVFHSSENFADGFFSDKDSGKDSENGKSSVEKSADRNENSEIGKNTKIYKTANSENGNKSTQNNENAVSKNLQNENAKNFVPNSKSIKIELRADSEFFKSHENDFAVKEIFLEKINSDYTLSLKVVPWKTGYLIIPPFDLLSLLHEAKNSQVKKNSRNFMINLKPIPINSLAEKNAISDFRPQAAPKTIPGTLIFLAVRIGIYIFLIFAAIFAILKIPATAKIIENFAYLFSLRKNSRKTAKKLKNLLSSSQKIKNDKDFAQNLQNILREFLKKRFSRDFSSVSTNAIYQEFENLLGGELSEFQDEAVENLIEVFFRTDFIRYSPNSAFQDGEREKIILKSLEMLSLFDTNENEIENEKNKNEKRGSKNSKKGNEL